LSDRQTNKHDRNYYHSRFTGGKDVNTDIIYEPRLTTFNNYTSLEIRSMERGICSIAIQTHSVLQIQECRLMDARESVLNFKNN